jgi:hypothetical protein
MPAAVAFLGGSLRYFSVDGQSKTSGRERDQPGKCGWNTAGPAVSRSARDSSPEMTVLDVNV